MFRGKRFCRRPDPAYHRSTPVLKTAVSILRRVHVLSDPMTEDRCVSCGISSGHLALTFAVYSYQRERKLLLTLPALRCYEMRCGSRERPVVNVMALNFSSNLCQDSSGTMTSTDVIIYSSGRFRTWYLKMFHCVCVCCSLSGGLFEELHNPTLKGAAGLQ